MSVKFTDGLKTTVINEHCDSLFIMHHGAGHTSAVFTILIQKLLEIDQSLGFLTFDMRGHGSSFETKDYSLESLSLDLSKITNALFQKLPTQIILVGHSLGGAVVVDVAVRRLIKNVVGVVVLDVVEKTALDSLEHMIHILKKRPTSFKNLDQAVNWACSNTLRNIESARHSIPDQLKLVGNEYTWITNLEETQTFWHGWFKDLSSRFLSIQGGRLLCLAGSDRYYIINLRLDETLLIGQMQGKYQLVVFNDSGHSIHEDSPDKLAELLVTFLKRNMPIVIKKFHIPLNVKNGATRPEPKVAEC